MGHPLISPEKDDVNVGAQPDVIGQIETILIRVLINHNLVRIPKPVTTKAVVCWGNAEIEAAEPEALPPPSPEPEDMAGAKAAPETPVLPWMI